MCCFGVANAVFIHIPSLKNMSENMTDRMVKCMEELYGTAKYI